MREGDKSWMLSVEEGKGSGSLHCEAPGTQLERVSISFSGCGYSREAEGNHHLPLVDQGSTTEPHPNPSLRDSRQGLC